MAMAHTNVCVCVITQMCACAIIIVCGDGTHKCAMTHSFMFAKQSRVQLAQCALRARGTNCSTCVYAITACDGDGTHTHLCDDIHTHLCDCTHTHLCDGTHTNLCDGTHTNLCDGTHTHLCDGTHKCATTHSFTCANESRIDVVVTVSHINESWHP